jgi:hypothetical protein
MPLFSPSRGRRSHLSYGGILPTLTYKEAEEVKGMARPAAARPAAPGIPHPYGEEGGGEEEEERVLRIALTALALLYCASR